MNNISMSDLKREFAKSILGMIGIGIICVLIGVSVIAAITIPDSTFQEWNNQ